MGGIYTEKKKKFIISALYYLILAVIVYILLKYAVFIVLPFVIGFATAAVLNPIVRFLWYKFSMKPRPTSILILLVFYGTIGILLAVAVVKLTVWIGDFSGRLPSIYYENIEPLIARLFEWVNGIISRIDGQETSEFSQALVALFESVKASLGAAVSDVSVRVLSKLSGFAAAIPGFIIELLFAIVSSFFFITDYENILGILKSRLPDKAVGVMSDMRDKFFVTVIKYLRSYVLIMLITFSELFFGLSIIGTQNAAFYAFLISLLDIMPAIGTGAVMIPWAVIDFFRNNTSHGIVLLVLWAAITVIRNIIEPRIVGRQVGLHPLVTLMAMFVGTKLFGFFGLLFLPIVLSIAASVIRERNQSSASV